MAALASLLEEPCPTERQLRRARWAVAFFFFVNGANVGAWVPHVPDRARALHLNTAQLGLVMLASGLGASLAMPFAGWVVSRVGSRRVSFTAGCCFPLALCGVLFAPSAKLMALAFALFGISGATMDIAMNAQGIAVERLMRRRTLSLFHGLWSVGGFAGSAATSALLSHHVRPTVTAGVTAAVLMVLLIAAGPQMLPHSVEGSSDSESKLRFEPRLLLVGVLILAAMISEGSIADWSAVYLRVARGLGAGVVGYGYAIFAAAMVLGRFTGDRTVARLGEVRVLVVGGLLASSGLLLTLHSGRLGISLAGFALVGAGLANASPVLYRTAGQMPGLPPGAGLATAVGMGYAGLLAGPPLLGFVGRVAGVGRIFDVIVALCLLLAACAPLLLQLKTGTAAPGVRRNTHAA